MAISTTTNRWSYTGDAATVNFAYTNRVFATTDLKVYLDGVLKTLTTHYTVSNITSPSGGNVTFLSAPAAAVVVLIVRDVPDTQPTTFSDGDDFPADTVNEALDRLIVQVQQLADDVSRRAGLATTILAAAFSVVFPTTMPAYGVLSINSAGTGFTFSDAATDDILAVTASVAAAAASATAAAASATAAASSATAAASSATTASTQATNAAASASTASTQATNAAASASTASTQATNAAASASTASTQATNAAASATAAQTAAGAVGMRYGYSTNTASSDPTAGIVKFNNTTIASATEMYISETDANAVFLAALLATLDDGTSTIRGKLRVWQISNPALFADLNITGTLTDNGTWDTFTVAHVAGPGGWANAAALGLHFTAKGDKGDTGATGATGPAGGIADGDYTDVAVSGGGTVMTVDSASPSQAGKIEQATAAETDTGTDTARAVTPDVLAPLRAPACGMRLSLQTAVPVMVTTQSAKTTVYLTPYLSQFVPVYDGTNMINRDVGGELSQATADSTKSPAAATTNSNYDLFAWLDGATWRCTRGPAWTSDTGRGTGAGTTELVMIKGVHLNAVAITNGPGAQRGTYVGTVRTNGSSQVDWIFGASAAGGTAGVIGVWNKYNRLPVKMQVQDSTASWSYVTATWRAANASAAMRVSFVRGLNEDPLDAEYIAHTDEASGGAGGLSVGVTIDSTSAAPTAPTGNIRVKGSVNSRYAAPPGLGFHYAQAMERGHADVSQTSYGNSAEQINGLTVDMRA